MPGCGAMVRSGTIRLVRSAGVLRWWCGGNGDNRVQHVAPSRAREVRAPHCPRLCRTHQRIPRGRCAKTVTHCAPFLQYDALVIPSGERLGLQ
jgi:hypothetical protein